MTTIQFPLRSLASGLALAAVLGGAALAQEARLTGQVAEVFGDRIVLSTPEGRILVTLPQGAAAPAPGAGITVEGRREGATMQAHSLEPAAGLVAPALAAASVQGLPPELAALGLAEVITRQERPRHGGSETYIHGRLPDGAWLRAKLRDGRLAEAQVSGGTLPPALVEALLPASLRGAPELGRIARIVEIDRKPEGEIEVEGYAADGARIEVAFDRNGRLRKFERDQRDDRRALSEAAMRERLASLGYTTVGFVNRGGRHAEAVAVNPWGEWVEVRLNERGEIDRERAFRR